MIYSDVPLSLRPGAGFPSTPAPNWHNYWVNISCFLSLTPFPLHCVVFQVVFKFLRRHNGLRTSAQAQFRDRSDLQRSLVAKPRYTLQLFLFTIAIDDSHELTGILMLNIYLLIPIMTSVANGIDSSNLNGLSLSRSKSAACAELQNYRLAGFTRVANVL